VYKLLSGVKLDLRGRLYLMFERNTDRYPTPIRKIAVISLLVFTIAGIAILVVFSWVLPGLAVDRAQTALQSKLGLEVRISHASVGWTGCELQGFRAVLPSSKALSFESPKVIVRANLIGLAIFGYRAISAVEVSSLQGRLTVPDPGLRKWIDRFAATERDGSVQTAEIRPIQLILSNYRIEVTDPLGEVIKLSGNEGVFKTSQVEAKLASLSVGLAPGTVVRFSGVQVALGREKNKTKLRKLEIQQTRVELAVASPRNDPPPRRVSNKKSKNHTAFLVEDANDKKDDRDSLNADKDTFQRIERLVSWFKLDKSERSDKPEPRVSDNSGILSSLSERLSDNLMIEMRDATISNGPEQGGQIVMKGLRGTVKARLGGEFDLDAQGSGRAGGALACKLKIWPVQLRAEGHLALRSLSFAVVTPFLPSAPWYEQDKGIVDGELDLVAESIDRLAITGMIHVQNASLASERIAPTPVREIEVNASGKGKWYPTKKRLEIAEAQVDLNGTELKVRGAAEFASDHYLLDLSVKLPLVPCNQAVGAIPRDLLGELASFDWKGRFGGEVTARIDSRELDKTELNIATRDQCVFLNVPASADLRRFHLPFTHQVIEPDGSLFQMETGPGTANWSYLEDISPFVLYAVMAHEDAGFISHRGFSQRHIRDALVRNLKEKRYAVGASTITMQLVKNLFLKREKTLARKVQEVLLTWWLERVLEKREIFELYLNVIEYGPGIYGIRNAARYYFGRTPAELSPAEAVYLSTILPNPKRYHAFFEKRSVPPSWLDLMRPILRRLGEKGWISTEAMEYGLAELSGFRFYGEGEAVLPRKLPAATNPFADGQITAGRMSGESMSEAMGDIGDMTIENESMAFDDSGTKDN
jgi:hypothetical protein